MSLVKKNIQGQIFLSGGGGAQDSFLLDREFINSLKQKKVLYIPIALTRDVAGFEACYDWITNTLSLHSHDFIDVTMWLDLNNRKIDDLLKFDALYFGGGNTYKLYKEILDTEFNKLIIEFLDREGVYYGGSAGAIILGKYIDTAQFADKNSVGLKEKKGLNRINDYSIWCHYNEKWGHDSQIKSLIKMGVERILALPEKSGIRVSKKKVEVIGYENISVFIKDAKYFFRPGECFS